MKLILFRLFISFFMMSVALMAQQKTKIKDFTFSSLDDKSINLYSLKGDIVLIDFWATWCGPCIIEIPEYNNIFKKFSESAKFKMLSVVSQSGVAKNIISFIDKKNIKYPVYMINDNYLIDLNIYGFPTTYLIDAEGTIVFEMTGYSDKKFKELDQKLSMLLK